MLYDNELLIGEHNYQQFLEDQEVDGERKARGLIPRNYETHPLGCYGAALPFHVVDFPTIPPSEWSERLQEKIAAKALLSDVRMNGNNGQPIPSLDQNGKGYCWAHSSTSCTTLLRAVANEPYVGLSAYAIACIIKRYQDEGGWGAQSLDFIMTRGVPSYQFWPAQSMSRSNDKPETWANAAKHKVTEGWIDLQAQQYDRTLSREQFATCWLLNIPTVNDYNWWSHSVCGMDLVDGAQTWGKCRAESGKLMTREEFDRVWEMDSDEVGAGFGCRIWNSWGDGWSEHGMGVLAASKAWPNSGVAPRVTVASPV